MLRGHTYSTPGADNAQTTVPAKITSAPSSSIAPRKREEWPNAAKASDALCIAFLPVFSAVRELGVRIFGRGELVQT
ncbi:hypothetical protein JOF43_002718 [Brachybacterium sacelli]|uniref:Uncharacterized protein n=1 Tax=Brachybacterium sacelli TaxID=173364 RepID=A0ABS4X2S9_9MICO|nr:hypothetical protein [Brachybacterium sacelli]